MICVEDVKIFQVERNQFELGRIKRLGGPANKEVIVGRIFINTRGEEIVLAMTREVQITIGLPFEVFESQGKQIADLSREIGLKNTLLASASTQLSSYRDACFFNRLKYLFTGRV